MVGEQLDHAGRTRGPVTGPRSPTLQAFFTGRLIRQRQASPNTIAAYRDTWRLLLGYCSARTAKQPSDLQITDLDAPLIGGFLDHLEQDRGNSARTRNARLAAIHSLFSYAALQHPEHAQLIARVVAIPPKRFDKALVTWLTENELNALLAAPDKTTWAGRRDHAMILLAAQTGLRISELTGLTRGDVHLGAGPHVRCLGKGRKQRITPAHQNNRHRAPRLARRTPGPARATAVPEPDQRPAQPRRGRAAARQPPHHSHRAMPIAENQEHHHAHAASHSRHATAARRGRHVSNRALARPLCG
jgi:integrase